MNAYKLKPKAKRNPVYQQGFEQGRQAGKHKAVDMFHAFLIERMASLTDVEGIGEKTALKVFEHFSEGIEKNEP